MATPPVETDAPAARAMYAVINGYAFATGEMSGAGAVSGAV